MERGGRASPVWARAGALASSLGESRSSAGSAGSAAAGAGALPRRAPRGRASSASAAGSSAAASSRSGLGLARLLPRRRAPPASGGGLRFGRGLFGRSLFRGGLLDRLLRRLLLVHVFFCLSHLDLSASLGLYVDAALARHGQGACQVPLRRPQPRGVLELPRGMLEAQVEQLLARGVSELHELGSSRLCTSTAFSLARLRAGRTWS